uniref:Uncharacterized protein n=1 Tax=Trichogramma kaykai TaxID=54128 RepID=A0ABD2X8V3_9HYME
MMILSRLKKYLIQGAVPPRFELGSLDSESRVLTITPWDPSKRTLRVNNIPSARGNSEFIIRIRSKTSTRDIYGAAVECQKFSRIILS